MYMYLLEYHHPYENIWDRDNNSFQQSADNDNLTSKSINGKLRALWLAKMVVTSISKVICPENAIL